MPRRKRGSSFVMLPRDLLDSDAWTHGLSSSAKIVYIHIKKKYVGHNNGAIVLHYSEVAFMASATVSKALKQLVDKGWVTKTRIGGMYRYRNEYSLTGTFDPSVKTFVNTSN